MSAAERDPSLRRRLAGLMSCAVLGALFSVGCGDDAPAQRSSANTMSDAGSPDADAQELPPARPCEHEPMGTPCADGKKHCIAGRCVFNVCGDGVKTEGEACDDGNEVVGDGCDPACKSEPKGCGNAKIEAGEECDDGNRIDQDDCANACTKNECGNERVDVAEECDDGNKLDGDQCSSTCLVIRCRNGRMDPGEACDDGNQVDNDGCTNKCRIMVCGNGKREEKEECDDGNTVADDACSEHCTKNECGNQRVDRGEECDGTANCDPAKCISVPDLCTPCEEKYCADYMGTGLNLVAGCRRGDTTSDVGRPKDQLVPPAEFLTLCQALLACAQSQRCVTEPTTGGLGSCYCGSATADECIQNGPATDAACVEPFFKATATMDNQTVTERMSDFAYPAGWGNFLAECDYLNCKAECLPGVP